MKWLRKKAGKKGLGKFAKDGPNNGPRVTNSRVPIPESFTDPSPRHGEDLSGVLNDDYNDKPTVRGVRKGFS